MPATASVQDQGWTGASLAIVLWRVVDEDVAARMDGLGVESEEVVQELGRSLTCCEIMVSECMSKVIWKAARMLHTRLRSPERHGLGGVARTFEMADQVGRRKA